tara:strand:+ start:28 stop:672 length:645 start_codon:yes stop_codon:yes gene_type:complete
MSSLPTKFPNHFPTIDNSLGNGIEIIDNFMPEDFFFPFASAAMRSNHFLPCDFTATEMESDGCLNTFGDYIKPNDDKNFAEVMFQAVPYVRNVTQVTISDFYKVHEEPINMIKDLLNIKKLWMLRLNCTVGQEKPHLGMFHKDFNTGSLKTTTVTSILYLNSNNGGTQFHDKDGPIVQSKKNRLVKFPCDTFHAGIWSTDAKLRHVLNLNYEEN